MTYFYTAIAFVNAIASSLEDWGLEGDEAVEVDSDGTIRVDDVERDERLTASQRRELTGE